MSNTPASLALLNDITTMIHGWYDDIPFFELKAPASSGYDYSVRPPA